MGVVTEQRLQFHGPDTRDYLTRQASLDGDRVVKAVWPSAVEVIDDNGNCVPVINSPDRIALQSPDTHSSRVFCEIAGGDNQEYPTVTRFHPETVADTHTAIVVPAGPWFDLDLMALHVSHGQAASLVDIPEVIRAPLMSETARIMQRLQYDYNVAIIGYNNSMAGLNPYPGLQSVLEHHHHMGTYFSPDLRFRSPEDIILDRESLGWDNGLSRIAGERLTGFVKNFVLPAYWPSGAESVHPDNLGLTFFLPGFYPAALSDPNFIHRFATPISHHINHQLGLFHQQFFDSQFTQVVDFVLQAHQTGQADMDKYRQFFKPLSAPNSSEEAALLKNLWAKRQLREGFGWCVSATCFKDCQDHGIADGAFIAITFGFGNWAVGPVEGLGTQLVRLKEPLPRQEQDQRSAYYRSVVLGSE